MAEDNLGFSFGSLVTAQNKAREAEVAAEGVKAEATRQAQAVATRNAAASITALQTARGIKAGANASATRSEEAQRYLVDDAAELARIEQEAIQLSNSNKPGDKLTLWMKQMSDPRYTRQYNSERQSKLTQTSTTLNHFEAMKQAAANRQLEAIRDDLDLTMKKDELSLLPIKQQLEIANLVKEQGASAVTALNNAIKDRHTQLAEDVSMQNNVLENLTDDQVKEAQSKAQATDTKSTNIGGVEIKLGILDTVAIARNDRAYLVANRELETAGKNESIAKVRRTKFMQTLSPGELNRLILDGGAWTYPNGDRESFDIKEAKDIYTLKSDAIQKTILDEAQLAGIGDGRSIVSNHAALLDKSPEAVPGTPLWGAQVAYKSTIRTAAGVFNNLKDDQTPEGKTLLYETTRMMNDALATQQEMYAKEVEKEAVRVGAGNTFRTNLERTRLQGLPASTDMVEAEVTTRAVTGKPLTDLLGSEQSAKFQKIYNATLAKIQIDQTANNAMGITPDSNAMKQEAASIAYAAVMKETGETISKDQIPAQVLEPSHPLYGLITPQGFSALQMESDAQGEKEFMAIKGITPAELAQVKAGKTIKDATPDSTGDIPILQQSALFSRVAATYGFDRADEMASWWGGQKGAEFVAKQTDLLNQHAVKEGGAKYVTASASIPAVQENLGWYGRTIQAGIRNFQTDRVEREMSNFRSFGSDPGALQITLLTQDTALTDVDKQDIYTQFINPLLQESKTKGLNFEQANLYIEKTLRTAVFDDPRLKALHKKFLRTRETAVDQVGAVVKSQSEATFGGFFPYGFPGGTHIPDGDERQRTAVSAKWYKDMLAAQKTATPALRGTVK